MAPIMPLIGTDNGVSIDWSGTTWRTGLEARVGCEMGFKVVVAADKDAGLGRLCVVSDDKGRRGVGGVAVAVGNQIRLDRRQRVLV